MQPSTPDARRIRFGPFELDLRAEEVRKDGLNLKLHGQPTKVLAMLLEHPGDVVTREELKKRLWQDDTFVDFDHSLNTAINKIREALRDSAESPKYVETIPRRGYRFIASVEAVAGIVPGQGGRPQRTPLRRWAGMAFAGVALIAAVLVGLNVAGLRVRVLKGVGAVREPPLRIESIAVLPLENLSRDPEQEYFADGMTDELITNLSKVRALRVISRTTAMHYKGSKKTLPEIAGELNVDAVVESSVLRSGNRVRITANLLHAPTDRHLWAETYESEMRDVLMLQSEVTRAISHEIQVQLTPQEQMRLGASRKIDPGAYEAYLRGLAEWNRLRFHQALSYFQQAAARDPDYAPAHVGLADCYFKLADMGGEPPVEMFAKSKAAALRAISLDSTLGEPHALLGIVTLYADWDWAAAEGELQRGLALSPNYSLAHEWYGAYLLAVNRLDEATAEERKAVALDPAGRITNAALALVYLHTHQYDRSLAVGQRMSTLFPDWGAGRWFQAESYLQKGMFDETVREYLKAKAMNGDKPEEVAAFEQAYAKSGIRGFWKEEVQSLKATPAGQPASAYDLAVDLALLGDKDRAFESLGTAYKARDGMMPWFRSDPRLASLHLDPRFKDLVRRMNFPP